MAASLSYSCLVRLCVMLPAALAACEHPNPSGECIDDSIEDASILLQKHALTSNIEAAQTDDIAIQLEDKLEDDLSNLDKKINRISDRNASYWTCPNCRMGCLNCKRVYHGITMSKRTRAQCKKELGKSGKGSGVAACMRKIMIEGCKDNCTYVYTPCEQCKRNVTGDDVMKSVVKKCRATASDSMKKLCADSCPSSQNFGGDGLARAFLETDSILKSFWDPFTGKNGSGSAQKKACHTCQRRDHNFHTMKKCLSMYSKDNLKRLACIGDGIQTKCKEKCTFDDDPCYQCKLDVIIYRKNRIVRNYYAECLDKGRTVAKSCADKCSSSLAEEEQYDDNGKVEDEGASDEGVEEDVADEGDAENDVEDDDMEDED